MTTPNLAQFRNAITSSGLPTPSDAFLQSILQARPLAALAATARHRLLSSNLASTSTSASPAILSPQAGRFPAGLTDVTVKACRLADDVCVQVLDVEDIGHSRWEQVDALEKERRGETVKGREVIRVVPDLDDAATQTQTQTQAQTHAPEHGSTQQQGPFKLLVQDAGGLKIYALELRRVEKISMPRVRATGTGMSIGCKLMLRRGTKVARGVVLLEPKDVVVLGGKIEVLDKAWREGREKRLRDEVGDTSAR
ncbi:mediated genome instability protein rmi1 [Phlyctema vagabunda]|uniref:Mediated genome instability protein rmi1 n=1 Tax=Phlyctema vagabunda TaxID=108571 RepID=A0ABR4PSH4_9HELO